MTDEDLDAERGVLGSVLIDNNTLSVVSKVIRGVDFSRASHAKIFDAMERLPGRAVGIDEITLKDELLRSGDLEAVGGPAYLASLADRVPTSAHAEYYARIVKEKAKLRGLGHNAERLLKALSERNGSPPGQDLADILGASRQFIGELEGLNSGQTSAPVLEPLNLNHSDTTEGVPVTFGHGDGEALQATGDFTLVAGPVGGGKSLFTLGACASRSVGAPFLGFPCSGPGRVMAVTADGDGPRIVRRRASGSLRGVGGNPADCPQLRIYAPEVFRLDDPTTFSWLRTTLDEFDPDLLALDSWISVTGPTLDQASATEIQDFIASRVRPLQARPDGSRRDLLLVAHLRKRQAGPGANSIQDRVAGSYYVLGGADSCIGIEASGAESFIARPVKRSRTGATFRPFSARIEGQGTEPLRLVNLGRLEPTETERAAAESEILQAASILTAVRGSGTWLKVADLKRQLGVTKDQRARARAIERAAASLGQSGGLEVHATQKGTYRLPPSQGAFEMEGGE